MYISARQRGSFHSRDGKRDLKGRYYRKKANLWIHLNTYMSRDRESNHFNRYAHNKRGVLHISPKYGRYPKVVNWKSIAEGSRQLGLHLHMLQCRSINMLWFARDSNLVYTTLKYSKLQCQIPFYSKYSHNIHWFDTFQGYKLQQTKLTSESNHKWQTKCSLYTTILSLEKDTRKLHYSIDICLL